ncbi:MAG: N-acetyl-alpha-D-glucosaminyl L-malate synthase BshA [bacterium]
MTAPRNILRIGTVCYPTQGGSGIVAVELAHQMAARGHHVHVISYAQPARLDTLRERVMFHPVRVPDYPLFEYPPYSLALAAQISEVIRHHSLDILHVHYALPHATSAWLGRRIAGRENLPIITTLHGTDITIIGNDPSYLDVTRFSIEISDAVTTVSAWLAKRVNEVVGCECESHMIHNFVDHEQYLPKRTAAAQRLRSGSESPLLMHVSNFRPVKRVGDVIDSFLNVREQRPVKLVMVGDGPDRLPAENRLKVSPYGDDVLFLGFHDAIEEILPAADLLLLPSDAESFGLAALEAMACGVPVIGANAGGLPEVVTDGLDGRLLPVGDSEGMARAILDILDNPGLHRKMAAAARETAVKRFSPESIVQQYEDLYFTTLDQIASSGSSAAVENLPFSTMK